MASCRVKNTDFSWLSPLCRKWAVMFCWTSVLLQHETHCLFVLVFFSWKTLILNSHSFNRQTLRTTLKYVVWKIWWEKAWQGISFLKKNLFCFRETQCYFKRHGGRTDWCFVTANQYLSAGSLPRSGPGHDWGLPSSPLISQANLKQMMCMHMLQIGTSGRALLRFKLS